MQTTLTNSNNSTAAGVYVLHPLEQGLAYRPSRDLSTAVTNSDSMSASRSPARSPSPAAAAGFGSFGGMVCCCLGPLPVGRCVQTEDMRLSSCHTCMCVCFPNRLMKFEGVVVKRYLTELLHGVGNVFKAFCNDFYVIFINIFRCHAQKHARCLSFRKKYALHPIGCCLLY